MASLSGRPARWRHKFVGLCDRHLNFYRVHVLAFLIIPLVSSGIFYASNGEHKISYVDSLFMCTSAMTVTGLQTVLLGDLTTWQQVLLFILMCIGSVSGVSVLMILIRRHFFRKRFEHLGADPLVRAKVQAITDRDSAPHFLASEAPDEPDIIGLRPTPSPAASALFRRTSSREDRDSGKARQAAEKRDREKERERRKKYGISPDMVKRMDAPVRVNAMSVGGVLDTEPGETPALPDTNSTHSAESTRSHTPQPSSHSDLPPDHEASAHSAVKSTRPQSLNLQAPRQHLISRSEMPESPTSITFAPDNTRIPNIMLTSSSTGMHDAIVPATDAFPRSNTIGFSDPVEARVMRKASDGHLLNSLPRTPSNLRVRKTRTMGSISTKGENWDMMSRTRIPLSAVTTAPQFQRTRTLDARQQDFGGFPNPVVVAGGLGLRLVKKVLPEAISHEIRRNSTLPRTSTLQSIRGANEGGPNSAELGSASAKPGVKMVSYISFDAIVGRNSNFRNLTSAQKEELGGVEYRALNLLSKLVVAYWLFFQLIAVAIIAPWLAVHKKYENVFGPAHLGRTWFSFFQVSSAYTNCGMSLIDASMTVFQDATLMILVISILILAGNTAFPVYLRLLIWLCSKLAPSKSKTKETLQFLLDHPRRCFIYLFPSYQTWFLVFALFVLNCTDWISFLVLDIGNPVIESLAVPKRVLAGLLQSFAVRAAGFQIVSLSQLAPAVNVLYAIMMYIAVYPIALSIRTSNVYEDKYLNHSMGIFAEEDSDDSSEEEKHAKSGNTASYIAFHARKQLAFDIWWLVGAVWIICIVEKDQIEDPNNTWINVFTILFELISAYGTVGLSQGLPYSNTSLSGGFRKLSKLIVIAVMIRGRHRGLPIALDRAVLLPSDLVEHDDFPRSFSMDSTTARSYPAVAPLTQSPTHIPDEASPEIKFGEGHPVDKAATTVHAPSGFLKSLFHPHRHRHEVIETVQETGNDPSSVSSGKSSGMESNGIEKSVTGLSQSSPTVDVKEQ